MLIIYFKIKGSVKNHLRIALERELETGSCFRGAEYCFGGLGKSILRVSSFTTRTYLVLYINKRSHSVPGHYVSQMKFKLGSLHCADVMVHKTSPELEPCTESVVCLYVLRACAVARDWLENLCHAFPASSAETSVSPAFGLGAE